MLYFAVGELPEKWQSVILLPGLLAFVAVGVWVWGRTAELKSGARPWKWFAGVPMALALFAGLPTLWRMRDFIYRMAIEPYGTKMVVSHYAAVGLPILCTAALVGWEWWDHKKSHPDY